MKVNQVYDCSDILISIAPIHTESILSGKKTVELRRRRMNVSIGTRVWIYSKLPVGSVQATAIVEKVCHADPQLLWSEFQDVVGITRAAFDEYFDGCIQGCAVVLGEITPVRPAIQLADLRTEVDGFHPPQFFKRLRCDQIKLLVRQIESAGKPHRK